MDFNSALADITKANNASKTRTTHTKRDSK